MDKVGGERVVVSPCRIYILRHGPISNARVIAGVHHRARANVILEVWAMVCHLSHC